MERLVYLVKMKLLMGFMYLFTLVFAATGSIRIKTRYRTVKIRRAAR